MNEGNAFKKYLIRSVPNAFFEKTLLLADRVDNSLQDFFTGLMKLVVLETGFLGVGLWCLGMRAPFLFGFLAALLALVPYVGSAIGCIIILDVAATDFPTRPEIVYLSLGLCLLVRALDDFVFVPLTIGRSLHIHPAVSVLLLFVGGIIAGPLGLIVVPAFVRRGLHCRGHPKPDSHGQRIVDALPPRMARAPPRHPAASSLNAGCAPRILAPCL